MSQSSVTQQENKRKIADIPDSEMSKEKRQAFENIKAKFNDNLYALHEAAARKRLEVVAKLQQTVRILKEARELAVDIEQDGVPALEDLKHAIRIEFPRHELSHDAAARLRKYDEMEKATNFSQKVMTEAQKIELLELTVHRHEDLAAKSKTEAMTAIYDEVWNELEKDVISDVGSCTTEIGQTLEELGSLVDCERFREIKTRFSKFSMVWAYHTDHEYCPCSECKDSYIEMMKNPTIRAVTRRTKMKTKKAATKKSNK
jgi:hypothetical protein